jgi:hypothetical protein
MANLITSDELGKRLCELLGLDPKTVSSIEISFVASNPIKITVTILGERSLESFDWRAVLDEAQVETVMVQ